MAGVSKGDGELRFSLSFCPSRSPFITLRNLFLSMLLLAEKDKKKAKSRPSSHSNSSFFQNFLFGCVEFRSCVCGARNSCLPNLRFHY
ncbi:hypothetical protein TWF102_012032 [Orbilia oligospora]|uniref:Uncharacterized protein n=1 Tax=Orbilia oligospora TaxID=2813651 RepID=A0A7C8J5Q7_ORBOL|nr:hypothetical protein TWF102_012032 [Orbilia oligospora]KAF3117549.1 hypothetical protein TWF103_012012 [Orbilia oligospora]